MKKYFYFLMAMFLVLSCSKDDDKNDNSRLENAYQNLKNNISGSWEMDAYHSTSRPDNPYQSLGWDEDMSFMDLNTLYKLSFTKEGNFSDYKGNRGTYSIYLDEDKKVYYGEDNSNFYWPFNTGAIYLKISCGEKFPYNQPYYAEIKNDGKLYLYNIEPTTGGDGVPHYRYKRQ